MIWVSLAFGSSMSRLDATLTEEHHMLGCDNFRV